MTAVSPVRTPGRRSPILVSTLTNGKTYTCTVHGTNAWATAPNRAASAATVPATVPSAPAQPTVTRGDASDLRRVRRTRQRRQHDHGLHRGLHVERRRHVRERHRAELRRSRSTGLTNGKTYTCTVLATNAVGNSAASAASATAMPGLVPSAPAPADRDARQRVDLGRVHRAGQQRRQRDHRLHGDAARRVTAARPDRTSGATSPIVVSALTNGKTYTCTVFATNANGAGNAVGRVGLDGSRDHAGHTRRSPRSRTATPRSRWRSSRRRQRRQRRSPATPQRARRVTAARPDRTSARPHPIVVSALDERQDLHVHRARDQRRRQRIATPSRRLRPFPRRSRARRPRRRSRPAARTMTVTFVAPANGGSAITGYTASCIVVERRHRRIEHRRASPIAVDESLARQDLHLHGPRDQRRGQRHGVVRLASRQRSRPSLPARPPSRR